MILTLRWVSSKYVATWPISLIMALLLDHQSQRAGIALRCFLSLSSTLYAGIKSFKHCKKSLRAKPGCIRIWCLVMHEESTFTKEQAYGSIAGCWQKPSSHWI